MKTILKRTLLLLVLAVSVARFSPAGIALITGIYARSAALIIIGMLIVSIIVISINVIRGLEFDCGCFSIEANSTANSAKYILGRNIILLIFGGYIFMHGLDKPRLSVSMKA